MKTSASYNLKIAKLTNAVNRVVNNIAEMPPACAGFKDTGLYDAQNSDNGKSKLNAAQVAAVLNYGSPIQNIPERPFMSRTLNRDYKASVVKIYKAAIMEYIERAADTNPYTNYGQVRYMKNELKNLSREVADKLLENINHSIDAGGFDALNPAYARRTRKKEFLDRSDKFRKLMKAWIDKDGTT